MVTTDEFRRVAQFVRVSAACVDEGHPHDIVVTRQSPNYTVAAVES